MEYCGYEDNDGESVFTEIGNRVQGEARDQVDAFKVMLEETDQKLDKVIANDDFKGQRDEAKQLRQRVNDLFDRIDRMTQTIRGGNHPVLAFMRKAGQDCPSRIPKPFRLL